MADENPQSIFLVVIKIERPIDHRIYWRKNILVVYFKIMLPQKNILDKHTGGHFEF